jgi:hypothetical protein
VQQYRDAHAQLKQLPKLLGDIEDVAGDTPASVGEIAEWAAIVNAAEENRASYCKGLHGKTLFSTLYGTYTVILDELKDLLKASTQADQTNSPKATGQQTTQKVGFQEVRRQKRRATKETAGTSKEATVQTKTSTFLNIPPKEVVTLRPADMDTDARGTEATSNEEAVPGR